jgi:hypothetical protein
MAILLENPVAIVVAGGVAATLALVVFLSRRSLGPLIALAAIFGLTLLLLVVERVVVTDREAIEDSVEEVLAAIEANNVQGVLANIDPAAAGVRSDVEALMPQIKVISANAGGILVEVQVAATAPTATSQFRAFLQGTHGSSGMSVAYINQRVDIEWVKRGDRWLISDYTAYYDNRPIDAVSSARGNRPVQ